MESNKANNLSTETNGKVPSKEEYFRLLQEWTNIQNAFRYMAYLPLTSPPAPPNTNNVNQAATQSPQNFSSRFFDQTRIEETIRINGGFELVLTPLYKRFIAEVIDTVILFLVKILFFVLFLDLGLETVDDFKDMKFLEDDYSQLLSLSSDFLLLEVVTKIVSCLYEAFFTVKLSATPGKLIMGIRILHAEAVLPLEQINHSQGIRSLVFPASQLSFKRALFRSCAKNLLVTLLFPVYFMLFFYKSNQLIYDLLGKTVVVDFCQNPVFRRREM